MEYLLNFLFCFLIIYSIYLFLIVLRKKGLQKFIKSKQLEYFKIKFKLNIEKINIKSFANAIALTNSFIISFTVTVIDTVDSLLLKLLMGFIILLPLMYFIYEALGKYYKKKEVE